METNYEVQKIEKQALTTFTIGAACVFSAALTYCYFTRHFMELGITMGAVLFLAILIINTYRSFNQETASTRPVEEYYFNH